jgi:hypothetical protein
MPFLTLNGTTVPVKSNALGQKYNEHRLDRDRMFDGTMRVIRQGVYRQFDVTTALLSDSDADAILALVNGNAIPLALDGDIVENLPISVIPVPGASTPVQFSGGFKRQLTFTLHETPVALPPDTSASVEAFWRGGFGYKKTAWAGVTAADLEALPDAGDGDAVSGWLDQTGNQRHWMGGVDNFSTNSHSDAKSPTRDGTSLRFAAASATNMRILQTAGMTTWWNGHVQIEVMLAFQVTDPAPSVDGKNAVWTIAARDVTATGPQRTWARCRPASTSLRSRS